MDYKTNAVEAVSQKVTLVSSGGAVFLGMTANEAVAIGGFLVALLSMIISSTITYYFKSQHLKLAIERDRYERAMLSRTDRRKVNIPVAVDRRAQEVGDE